MRMALRLAAVEFVPAATFMRCSLSCRSCPRGGGAITELSEGCNPSPCLSWINGQEGMR